MRKSTTTKAKIAKPVSKLKRKTVSVPVKEYNLVATQDTTVIGKGKEKNIVNGPIRFALMKGKDLIATTGNKKIAAPKFNKKFVKTVAPSVLPIVKKMVKAGELTL